MTARDLARVFHARKEGKNYRAKCPHHRSKGLTLGIYPKADRCILQCYAGCSSDDIMTAVGLKWTDLFYEQFGPEEPEARKARMRNSKMHENLQKLDRRAGIALWLSALEKPHYWRAAYRNIMREYNDLRHQLYVEEGTK